MGRIYSDKVVFLLSSVNPILRPMDPPTGHQSEASRQKYAVPYVDPAKLTAPSTPTKRVSDASDLSRLFESAGLNRVLSVIMNMSEAVADFGLVDDDEKRARLSQSTSLVCWSAQYPPIKEPETSPADTM